MEREARLINESDAKDAWLQDFMDETWRETLADLDESEAKSRQTKSTE
jgi:hypothetical protein